jgi:hypothetical protein
MMLRSSIRTAVFLGAGASRFANFPSVDSFFRDVWPRGGLANELCSELARMISINEQTQENTKWPVFNAEKLFASLEILERAQKILSVNGRSQPIFVSSGRGAEMGAVELMSELRREVARVYGAEVDSDTLANAPHNDLLKLLDTVLPDDDSLDVFTTNYDRLLERLFQYWDEGSRQISRRTRLVTGFSSDRPGQWRPELLEEKPIPGVRLIKLMKLHGSITWKKDAAGRPVETGYAMPTQHDSLLYFGYKSIPEEEPFLTLHNVLKSSLLKYDVFVVIGFRVADPYIRELFDIALRANENLRVICCLNRAPESGTPLSRIMSQFPGRVQLLTSEAGDAIAFGAPGFRERLEELLASQ